MDTLASELNSYKLGLLDVEILDDIEHELDDAHMNSLLTPLSPLVFGLLDALPSPYLKS